MIIRTLLLSILFIFNISSYASDAKEDYKGIVKNINLTLGLYIWNGEDKIVKSTIIDSIDLYNIKAISVKDSAIGRTYWAFKDKSKKIYLEKNNTSIPNNLEDLKSYSQDIMIKNHKIGTTTIFIEKEVINENISLTQQEINWINNNKIIIGTESWKPIVYLNENTNNLEGIIGDILSLVIEKLDLEVEIISGKWSDTLENFKNQKTDLLPALYYSKDREKFGNYSNEIFALPEYLYIKSNNNEVKNFDDMLGKKLAIIKGYSMIDIVHKKYPNIIILETENLQQSINYLIDGKVDALIDGQVIVENFIKQNLISGIKGISQDSFKSNKVYMLSNIKKPILKSIFNKGLNAISQSEKNKIISKWINQENTIKKNDFLTISDKLYLKAKKIIKMCNNPTWEPIEFAQNGDMNQMSGIVIDTLKILEKKLNVKFQNVSTKSWSESQQFLKDKKCDILPCATKTSKREKYANFTKPYLNLPLAIFTTRDKPIVSGLEDIIEHPWTRKKGSGVINKIKKAYPNTNVIETKDNTEALQMVNNNSAYFTIATLPVATNVISKYQLNNLQISGYTDVSFKLSMAVRDDDKILLSILDKGLEDISNSESKQIFKKWVGTTLKESVIDYTMVWNILIVVSLIILFFIYRQYFLRKSNKELKIAVDTKTEELKTINENLKNEIKKEVANNLHIEKQLFKAEKLASMGDMIGNIAHQWRQPLSVISTGSTGMLMQKEYGLLSDDDFIKTCNTINDNAQYLSKTIDDFKNFIKGDRTKKIFILKDDINSFLNLVEGSIKSNNINMILDLEENIKIDGYENELTQCLINIFNNAKDVLIEKKIEDKCIFITTTKLTNNVTIKIKDNAGGIPENIINKIFEPYFTTKHQSQGTGLGLHMTYNLIVDGMGGTIEANNVEFQPEDSSIVYVGAEFVISLPLS